MSIVLSKIDVRPIPLNEANCSHDMWLRHVPGSSHFVIISLTYSHWHSPQHQLSRATSSPSESDECVTHQSSKAASPTVTQQPHTTSSTSFQHIHTASETSIISIRSTDSDIQVVPSSREATGDINQYAQDGEGNNISLLQCLRVQFPVALLNPPCDPLPSGFPRSACTAFLRPASENYVDIDIGPSHSNRSIVSIKCKNDPSLFLCFRRATSSCPLFHSFLLFFFSLVISTFLFHILNLGGSSTTPSYGG